MADTPMSPEEAFAIAREIAEVLGGRQQMAIDLICRLAERHRRPSHVDLRPAGSGVQHFAKAKDEITQGLEEVKAIENRAVTEHAPDDEDPHRGA